MKKKEKYNTRPFSQVTLFANGDIAFVYEDIPSHMQTIVRASTSGDKLPQQGKTGSVTLAGHENHGTDVLKAGLGDGDVKGKAGKGE